MNVATRKRGNAKNEKACNVEAKKKVDERKDGSFELRHGEIAGRGSDSNWS